MDVVEVLILVFVVLNLLWDVWSTEVIHNMVQGLYEHDES
jgi:hypothetical protein